MRELPNLSLPQTPTLLLGLKLPTRPLLPAVGRMHLGAPVLSLSSPIQYPVKRGEHPGPKFISLERSSQSSSLSLSVYCILKNPCH